MRIFYNVVSNVNPLVQSVMNLRKCCEYFNLNVNEEKFHSALFDALMTSKMICKVYELLEKDKALRENKNVNYTANTIDMFLGGGGGSGSGGCEKKKKYSDLYCMINKMKEDKENIEKDPKRKFDNLFYIAKKTMKHVPKYNKSNNSNSSSSNSSITQLNQIQHKSNNNNNYNNNKTLNSFINVQPKHEPIKHNDDTRTHSITNPNISSSPPPPSSDIDDELLQFIEDSNTSPTTTT
jgi:hypothetical protein